MYGSHWPVLISAEKTMKTIYDIAAFWWVFRSMYIINIVSTYLTQFSLSLYIKKYNIKGKMQKKGKSLHLSAISTPSLCTTAPLPFDFFEGWREGVAIHRLATPCDQLS